MLKQWQAALRLGQHEPRVALPVPSAKFIRLTTLTNPLYKGRKKF